MYNIEISTEGIPKIIANLNRVAKGDLLHTKEAVKDSAHFIQERWRNVVATAQQMEYGGQTFAVHRRTGNYERSIVVDYPLSGDGLSAAVRATAPYAEKIEKGTEPYDMKPMLLNGRTYVHIPFRHAAPTGTPGTTPTGMQQMPQSIYNIVKMGKTLGQSSVEQRTKIIQAMDGTKKTYTWKTGMYSGMKNVGAKGHTQYMTFRTVSIHSDPSSWWMPRIPARSLSKAVAQSSYEFVKAMLLSGLEQDLHGMVE